MGQLDAFDYIVVGSGSAGSTLAYRLSEGGQSVLVVEAGTSSVPPNVEVVALWPTLLRSPVDWDYLSVPQAHLNGRIIHHPAGRLIGGSSNLYHTIHIRGHETDFDSWGAGWSFGECLPWFQKLEAQVDDTNPTAGRHGPLPVTPAQSMQVSPASEVFLEACGQAGHPSTDDFNGPRMTGAGWHHLNMRDGRRFGCRRAYLEPALQRRNVTLMADSPVTRLLIERGRCNGVEYVQDGSLHKALAEREVFLSAGGIGSPKLLMLSGVGPANHLREMGINVTADLKGVGRNFHDHALVVAPVIKFKQDIPKGNVNLSEACLFARSSRAGAGPDLQIGFVHAPSDIVPTLQDWSLATIIAGLVKPRSRGTVRLASSDPTRAPLVDANYFADEVDLDIMAEAMEVARGVIATPAMEQATLGEVFPGEQSKGARAVRTFLSGSVDSYLHYAGACRLGTDDEAVVDPQLRVRGIEGLRVVDGSVMPSLPSGNCHTAIVMIAERAADWAVRGA